MAPTQTRPRSLPEKPSAEHLRKQAKDLARGEAIQLAAAQRRLAREYGYRNWSELIRHVQSLSAAYKATRDADEATAPPALTEKSSEINTIANASNTHPSLIQR